MGREEETSGSRESERASKQVKSETSTWNVKPQ